MYRHSRSASRDGERRDDRSLSHATVSACNKNAVCKASLERDLQLLEKEKTRLLKSINHEAKLVSQHAKDRSPSPTLPSSPSRSMSAASKAGTNDLHYTCADGRPRSGSAVSPRRSGSRAGSALSPRRNSASPRPRTPSHSPPRSPRTSPMLTRRASRNTTPPARRTENVHATEPGQANLSQPVSMEEVTVLQNLRPTAVVVAHHDGPQSVPQIVVSDETNTPVAAKKADQVSSPGLAPQGSAPQGSASDDLGSEDDGAGSPLSSSLNLPKRRPRSNSMPGNVILPSLFKPPQRRPSYCSSPPKTSMENLNVVESPRERSSSFSGIVPARRRGSISENWGSISERKRPEMGNLGGRRTSVEMGNLLRDLTYGVEHTELMHNTRKKAVTQKQWEDLKKCRYLRMPSRENSEESIAEETVA